MSKACGACRSVVPIFPGEAVRYTQTCVNRVRFVHSHACFFLLLTLSLHTCMTWAISHQDSLQQGCVTIELQSGFKLFIPLYVSTPPQTPASVPLYRECVNARVCYQQRQRQWVHWTLEAIALCCFVVPLVSSWLVSTVCCLMLSMFRRF